MSDYNNTFSVDRLYNTFRRFSDLYTLKSGTGRIVITKRGARIIGVFPEKDSCNALWIYPGVKKSLENGHWMVGGERLWVAPEKDYFYKFPENFDGFFVSGDIDPGNYRHKGGLEFENRLLIENNSAGERFSNTQLKRSFNTIKDPFDTGMGFTGIRITDSARTLNPNLDLCCWSVTQLIPGKPEHPATVLFPCKESASFIPYFSEIPEDYCDVNGRYARFKIDSSRILKTALAPEDIRDDIKCKILYILPFHKESYFCIMKRTYDTPKRQCECLDIPKNTQTKSRGAVQAYNCGPGFSEEDDFLFGEIEIQSRGLFRNGRFSSTSMTHELLCYSGKEDDILELAAEALDLPAKPVRF
ncbi:MAG: hypothetical protein ACOCSE_03480 [Chitinivibrionales bacterium]